MKTKMIIAALALLVTVGLSAQTPQKTNTEKKKLLY